MIRRLAMAALGGQLVWLAFVAFGGLWEPGYSEIRDAVSFLGARDAASPWVFDAVVAVSGLSVIALAGALALDAPRSPRGRLGPALIAFTGLAQILDGFPFPADCRRTIDAGCHARELAGELSWQHYAHGWAYFFGGAALLLSVFAMAWRFRGDPRWGRADVLAFGAGIVAIVIFSGLFFFTGKGFGGHYGLAQRFALGAAIAWVGALALALLDLYGRRRLLGRTRASGEGSPMDRRANVAEGGEMQSDS
ncbi:MAG TPA: DUF998 domain-containing protein [Solirubrobacterales bacterium]|nr:DUF998 domain-containing protein [Solirubrobacterales bacterium]